MDGLPSYEEPIPPSYPIGECNEYAKYGQFRSYNYSTLDKDEEIKKNHFQQPQFIPNITEIIAHLKLLKAFEKLKQNFTDDSLMNDMDRDKKWRLYLTISVKRFIIFISALKSLMPIIQIDKLTGVDPRDQEFTSMTNELTPPLDVIMVWHAFMLNPMSFYDIFARFDMYYFINYPFPLHIINSYIDDQSYEFKVPEEKKKKYLAFVGKFAKDIIDYEFELDVDLSQQFVTLYCPRTKMKISKPIKLTDFVDGNFLTKNTGFKFNNIIYDNYTPLTITHDQLLKIKLDYDVEQPRLLEGSLKYCSKELSAPGFTDIDPVSLSSKISESVIESSRQVFRELNAGTPELVEPTFDEIIQRVEKDSPTLKRKVKESIIFGNYKHFNMISLTVQGGVQIGEDLVECVIRQEKFRNIINELNWLNSPLLKEGLLESLDRYHRFFALMTKRTDKILVPTLDIDLVWHTHQLMLYGYIRDCKYSPCQTVIDHNDKVQEKTLDYGYDYTLKLYKEEYGEDYSICFCNYCYSKRNKKLSHVFKSLKKEKDAVRSNPLFVKDKEGITHPSEHKSVSSFVACASRGTLKVSSTNGIAFGPITTGVHFRKEEP